VVAARRIILLCALPTIAAAQGVVRDGIEYVYLVSLSACQLYPRSKMESFIAQGKLTGKATSQRLLEDDGWELRFTDGSGVITWYAPLAETPLVTLEGGAYVLSRSLLLAALTTGLYHRHLNALGPGRENTHADATWS
jgi:hypothetical protein